MNQRQQPKADQRTSRAGDTHKNQIDFGEWASLFPPVHINFRQPTVDSELSPKKMNCYIWILRCLFTFLHQRRVEAGVSPVLFTSSQVAAPIQTKKKKEVEKSAVRDSEMRSAHAELLEALASPDFDDG